MPSTRILGNSDLAITPLGMGTASMGGRRWPHSRGPQNDADSIAAIRRALDLGINWIDTAPLYGLGHAEEVVGRALKGLREKPYIFTKCSIVWDENGKTDNNLSAASLRREIEDSLRRLQVETIDLYQIHGPIPPEDIEAGWATLAALQAEGKACYIAVSNFSVEQMRRIQQIAPITALQPPYSMLRREIEEDILPFCAEQNIGVIPYSPMQSGLLTGRMTRERIENMPESDHRRRRRDFQELRLSRNLALANLLTEIGGRHGHNAATAAIAWTLRHPAVTGAIVGARNPEQVDGFIAAQDFRLDEGELAQIETFLRENPVSLRIKLASVGYRLLALLQDNWIGAKAISLLPLDILYPFYYDFNIPCIGNCVYKLFTHTIS